MCRAAVRVRFKRGICLTFFLLIEKMVVYLQCLSKLIHYDDCEQKISKKTTKYD